MTSKIVWLLVLAFAVFQQAALNAQPIVIEDASVLWTTRMPSKVLHLPRYAYAESAGLLFVSTNGLLQVIRTSDGAIVDSVSIADSTRTETLEIACSRDAKVLCLTYRYWPLTNNLGGVLIMEYPSKRVIRRELDPPPPNGGGVINWASSRVSVSPSGRYIVVPWDSRFHVRILDLQRDTSWVIPGLPWRATSFNNSETVCATWDGPNSESDSNEGQCRVSWLSDPLNNFRNFEASYGSDVSDSELRLSHNGRYLIYSGSGTYDMQMRRLNPGITLWDIESEAKIYDSHYEGGGGPIWGFGPDDSWFVVWMSHPVFGNGTYVMFVGDSIPRYRFPTYSTFFNDQFSQAFFIKKADTVVSSREVKTDITPVHVAEEAVVLRYPYVKRGPALDNISVLLGTVECSLARDGGLEWQLYNSSMAVVANGRLMTQPDQSSSCDIIAKLNVVPASGLYILTYFSSTKKVLGSIKLMLE